MDITPDPTRTLIDGRPWWQWHDGTLLPVIAGAADDGDEGEGGEPESDAGGGEGSPGEDLDSLPSWARESLKKANREAASYRAKLRELEPLAMKAKELEDASKTDLERVTGERDEAVSSAKSWEGRALRAEIALAKGLTLSQAKRLVGSTREELEADADEMVKELGLDTRGEKVPDGKPRPKLRGGTEAGGDAGDDELDPRKLAARIPRR